MTKRGVFRLLTSPSSLACHKLYFSTALIITFTYRNPSESHIDDYPQGINTFRLFALLFLDFFWMIAGKNVTSSIVNQGLSVSRGRIHTVESLHPFLAQYQR